ncbi:hypothetical protein [Pyrococcus horikoshii]|uniref:Chromosome partition protein Smc n=2 Tax=Pyrococcus horikoshii TaxID=53953 RepID=O58907_PYRHO|nr:hypothetical protein [Pyrococcus horikoshii]BAA30289.1 270aa long hypothetical protein [Pyrococcus horikoshii OT3]HII60202.1 hypothetical protein [Pyrococcus horikoshii]
MKRYGLPILVVILLLGIPQALAVYSYTAKLYPGDVVYINNLPIMIDRDKDTNITAAILHIGDRLIIIKEGEKKEINSIEISVSSFNNYAILSISSEKPFEVKFSNEETSQKLETLKEENEKLKEQIQNLTKENEQLKNENAQLKRRISDLEKHLKEAKAQDISELQVQINNLTRENRELKEKIANQTNTINQLKAKAKFLEQQNNEYRTLITKLLEEQAKKSEQSYIEKAKREKLIGSVILKTLLVATGITGLIGFLLYRDKRSWEYGGL